VADPLDKVVVAVNGTSISERQLLQEIDIRISAQAAQDIQRGLIYDESSRDSTRAFMREDVVHMLIERILIADQLKVDRLEITEAEVEKRFAREAADRKQSLDDARRAIVEEGQTVQSVFDGLRQTMGVERLFEAHAADKAEMTEAEAREFYNGNPHYFAQPELRRVSRILFRFAADASAATKDAARRKAEDVLKRIKAGEEFATLAQQCSQDAASNSRGGDRGWSARGWVVTPDADPFGNAAFAMKNVGDVTDIVATQDGFDIIKLTGMKAAALPTFEEVEPRIRRDYRFRRIGDFWNAYAADLWKNARIERSSEELARQAQKEKQRRAFEQQMQAEAAKAKP
jgi:peptidyl-prolyl cis-trans isomerase C